MSAPSAARIDELEPQAVWRFFAGIAAIPRPSKKEERIRAHLREIVTGLGFDCVEDAIGNMVISVPASPGCETVPITVLQAHVDMVCEKNANVRHDFDREGIRLLCTQDDAGERIVVADGTTLGADNGMGVALALAAASEPDVMHGPLEILLTVDEEMGMTGANALAPDSFRGKRLINLDSEEDDILYIGCAGGCDTNLAWEFATSPVDEPEQARLTIGGLRGGHSGGDIHENRGNANKLLARCLLGMDALGWRIATLSGGSQRNAIPREAVAGVCGPVGLIDALREVATRVEAEARAESGEATVAITVATDDAPAQRALSRDDSRRLVHALAALPSGVLGMHRQVPGLVETSNNLSTIQSSPTRGGDGLAVAVGTLTRGSCESRVDEALAQIAAIGALAGADVSTANRYPGWDPNPDSPLLATCRRVYAECFGSEPAVAAIHAGLECGIIGQRVGGVDMISFGPRIEGAHSPDERVWVDSVGRIWTYLRAVLAELARD
jgi:dipeptidase D